jgi:hypothetical protein
VAYENNEKKNDSVYSKRIRAGKRRTYFFDVRATRGNDYFLTITESRKRFDDNGYDRHKIFLYKEDFNKFIKALGEAIDYVKTDLMPDFDFDAFNHEYPEGEGGEYVPENNNYTPAQPQVEEKIAPVAVQSAPEAPASNDSLSSEEVDKW